MKVAFSDTSNERIGYACKVVRRELLMRFGSCLVSMNKQ